jgi:hypothetical protein
MSDDRFDTLAGGEQYGTDSLMGGEQRGRELFMSGEQGLAEATSDNVGADHSEGADEHSRDVRSAA